MKKKIYNLYGFVNALKYTFILKESLLSLWDEKTYPNKKHIQLAAKWLLYMQNSDGGYSRKFSFIKGKDKSYIETTGYIIPTLIEAGLYLNEEKYINSALKAGKWLLEIQNNDGSFSEIDTNKPYAFDTGQCLIGLNYLYEYTKEKKYLAAAKKASYWLYENKEKDGSWQKVAYNNQKHTYYTRVAGAMYRYAIISDDEIIKQSALKHIQWVLDNQNKHGYFKYSSFIEGVPAYLHTLMYILEGLLDIYEYDHDKQILEAILKNSEKFKDINLNRDLILCSEYDEDFQCINDQRCITGLAQWAGVALRLYKITNDDDYKKCAINTLYYLKAKQLKSSSMKGGFSASIPFWGKYGGFDFVNWTNKFFIDSMLIYDKLDILHVKEQEGFVSSAFNIASSVVTDNLSYMDKEYINRLKSILPQDKKIKVLDIGCGKGVIIKELQKEFPNIEFYGVDPVFEAKNIKKGSIYYIPFEDKSFDVVMSFEVLQHTFVEVSLDEIYRVLKGSGFIVIGERNKFSILGILKPFLELCGKWMYPYDSPFREKWFSKKEWEYQLKRCGFEIDKVFEIEGNGRKFVNRYLLIKGEKI